PVDRFDNLLAHREHRLDIFVQDELEFLDGIEIGRVAHDDLERPILLGKRQHYVFPRHRFRHEFHHRLRNRNLRKVDKRHSWMFGLRADHLFRSNVAEFHKRIGQFRAGGLLERAGFLDLVGAEQPLGNEDVCEVAATLRHEDNLRIVGGTRASERRQEPRRPCNRHARSIRVPPLAGNFPSNYGTAQGDAREKMREVDYSAPFMLPLLAVSRPRSSSRARDINPAYPSSSSRSRASTLKSSSVVVSCVVALPPAMSRSSRRMIFPDLVFGNASVKRTSSGRARVPISLTTCSFSSAFNSSDGCSPLTSVTKHAIPSPLISS